MRSNAFIRSSRITPWDWTLPAGRALRLAPAPRSRWLQVAEGQIWLTPTARAGAASVDCWIAAGERLHLPARTEWVVEGSGHARYTLLEAESPAGQACGPATAWYGALGAWAQRLSFLPAPQVCV